MNLHMFPKNITENIASLSTREVVDFITEHSVATLVITKTSEDKCSFFIPNFDMGGYFRNQHDYFIEHFGHGFELGMAFVATSLISTSSSLEFTQSYKYVYDISIGNFVIMDIAVSDEYGRIELRNTDELFKNKDIIR